MQEYNTAERVNLTTEYVNNNTDGDGCKYECTCQGCIWDG